MALGLLQTQQEERKAAHATIRQGNHVDAREAAAEALKIGFNRINFLALAKKERSSLLAASSRAFANRSRHSIASSEDRAIIPVTIETTSNAGLSMPSASSDHLAASGLAGYSGILETSMTIYVRFSLSKIALRWTNG
jgi:hypothetical protein